MLITIRWAKHPPLRGGGGAYWEVGRGRASLVFWPGVLVFLGPNWTPGVWTRSVLLQEIISLS